MSLASDANSEAGRELRPAPGASGETSLRARRAPAEVKVWDPLVRVFHWGLVIAFLVAWLSGDELDRLHELAGYLVLGLIGFRLVWGLAARGLAGSRHARFSDFIYKPSTVLGYLKAMVRLRAPRYLGHNPAGGAMVVALLVLLGTICASGIMMTTDPFWGIAWVETLHETAVNITLGLILLHLLGVLFASLEQGENLVRAMITGRKRAS